MATLQGKYKEMVCRDGWWHRPDGGREIRNWCSSFTVKYTNVHDATLSRDISVAHDSCTQNHVIQIYDKDGIALYKAPSRISLSEALKSIGFVFQFCTELGTARMSHVQQNSIVHFINYEDANIKQIEALKIRDDDLNKREEELVLKENDLNKREEAQELAIDTLYRSIKQREEELVLKENELNKREEEELRRMCETYN